MVETPDGFVVALLAEVDRRPTRRPTRPARPQMRDALTRALDQDVEIVFAAALRDRAQPRVNRALLDSLVAMNAITSPDASAAFRAAYEAGRGTLVWTTGVADLETPVAAYLKLAAGRPNSFLLESIEGGAARSRYSIIGMAPDLVWRCRGGRAELNRHARSRAARLRARASGRALDSLRALIAESRMDAARASAADAGRPGRLSRLRHGAADGAAAGQEPRRARPARGAADPPDLFAVFDNVRDELTLAAPIYPQPGVSADRRLGARRRRRSPRPTRRCTRPLPHAAPPVALPPQPEPASNMSRGRVHGRSSSA